MKLIDDGHCFVCGPNNPAGLKLGFAFDGTSVRTVFTPNKEHQGYLNIVHGGILAMLLDEAMVKLSLALDTPAVTARMEIRLMRALAVGETVTVEARIEKETRKTIHARAQAVTESKTVVADATGRLMKVTAKTI